jgi:hypothetical protein
VFQSAIVAVTSASPLARYCCLGRAIAQSAEAVKADGEGEGVARLAFVELHGRLPAESRQLEPVECKQRALDPTDFAQGERQPVLARIGAEALG